MKPCSGSVLSSRTRTRSPTSSPSWPRSTRPSTGGWRSRTHVPFVRRAGDDPVELVADAARHPQRGRSLPHQPLDLVGGILLFRAVRREHRQLGESDRAPSRPGDGGLEQTLRHQIGKSPVRRGRMRVVGDREREVSVGRSRRRLPPRTRRVPSSLMTLSDRSANSSGRLARCACEKRFERARVGMSRQRRCRAARARSTMRGQRSGDRTTRRIEG